jgi:putative ABC transport system substrate-binding protein
MRERGYIEGQNLAFILFYAPADPSALHAVLPEILATPADLIVSSGPAIRAMKAATGRTILFAVSGDPVELGIVQSLGRVCKGYIQSKIIPIVSMAR